MNGLLNQAIHIERKSTYLTEHDHMSFMTLLGTCRADHLVQLHEASLALVRVLNSRNFSGVNGRAQIHGLCFFCELLGRAER